MSIGAGAGAGAAGAGTFCPEPEPELEPPKSFTRSRSRRRSRSRNASPEPEPEPEPTKNVTAPHPCLQPRAEVKNLGVVFDSTLSWESHVSELSRQCTGVLIGLSHCRHYLPVGVIKVLVSALVLTRIRYCLAVYGNGTLKNFDRLQRVLNFAVRVIFGRRKFDHVSDLREQLRWMSPQQMSQAQTLSLAHKVLRLGEPDSLADSFIRCRDVRQRSTRQDSLLHLPRPRTEAGRRRFAYRAPAL